jgi:hypothetical protein
VITFSKDVEKMVTTESMSFHLLLQLLVQILLVRVDAEMIDTDTDMGIFLASSW